MKAVKVRVNSWLLLHIGPPIVPPPVRWSTQLVLLAPLSARWAFRELVWARKEASINGEMRGRVDTHTQKRSHQGGAWACVRQGLTRKVRNNSRPIMFLTQYRSCFIWIAVKKSHVCCFFQWTSTSLNVFLCLTQLYHFIFIVSLSCFKLTSPLFNQLASTVITAFKEPNITFLSWIRRLFFRVLLGISAPCFSVFISRPALCTDLVLCTRVPVFSALQKPCGSLSSCVSLPSHSCSPEVKMAASDTQPSDIQVSGWSISIRVWFWLRLFSCSASFHMSFLLNPLWKCEILGSPVRGGVIILEGIFTWFLTEANVQIWWCERFNDVTNKNDKLQQRLSSSREP